MSIYIFRFSVQLINITRRDKKNEIEKNGEPRRTQNGVVAGLPLANEIEGNSMFVLSSSRVVPGRVVFRVAKCIY